MPRPHHRQPRPFAARLLWLIAAILLTPACSTSPTTPVLLPPLDSLSLRPDTLTIQVGESGTFTATAYDSLGNPVSGASFVWTTSDSAGTILTLSRGGRVSAVGEGSALVFAAASGLRDTGVVVVHPAQRGWYTQVSSVGTNLNGVFFQPDGQNGWVVGDAGKILVTHDAGAHWALQGSGTSFSLQAVWFSGPQEGWVVGNGGTVLHTTDGGANWNLVVAGTSAALMDVVFASDSVGWVVGGSGLAMRTTDGGATWQKRFPTTVALNSVAFAGTLDGWAVGDQGVIAGTHDGGASWYLIQPAITNQSLHAVWRRSESKAVAAGSGGVAPRTVSGPDSTVWAIANAGAANQLEGLHFPTDATGFAVGFNGSGAVLRTGDGGINWQPQVTSTQFQLNDVYFVDTDRGWAVGNNGTILHTATGGAP